MGGKIHVLDYVDLDLSALPFFSRASIRVKWKRNEAWQSSRALSLPRRINRSLSRGTKYVCPIWKEGGEERKHRIVEQWNEGEKVETERSYL